MLILNVEEFSRKAEAVGRTAKQMPFVAEFALTRANKEPVRPSGAGRTLKGINDGLNADGVPSPKGKRWWPSNVSYLLNNQICSGKVEFVSVTDRAVTHVNRQGAHAHIVR